MSAKKKPVSTPLHLLQQLSGSLLEHLEDACSQALADAEKLHNGRLKLQDAAKAGKAKAQTKAQKAIGELEELLDSLKERQTQTRSYIQQLKRDAQDSLKLAQGVGKVREAAAKALDSRAAKTSKPAAAKPAAKPAAKATAAAKPAAKPAAKATAAAKPAAKPAAKATAAAKSAAKPAAKPAAAKAPARRATKPAAAKPVASKPAEAKPATPAASTPAAATNSATPAASVASSTPASTPAQAPSSAS